MAILSSEKIGKTRGESFTKRKLKVKKTAKNGNKIEKGKDVVLVCIS